MYNHGDEAAASGARSVMQPNCVKNDVHVRMTLNNNSLPVFSFARRASSHKHVPLLENKNQLGFSQLLYLVAVQHDGDDDDDDDDVVDDDDDDDDDDDGGDYADVVARYSQYKVKLQAINATPFAGLRRRGRRPLLFQRTTWRDRHSHRTTSCICQIMVAPIEQASVASLRGRPCLRS